VNGLIKENFQYKHAKASWMSAWEAFRLVGYLAGIGAAEGNIDSVMRAGKFNKIYEEVLSPPAGRSDFRSCVPMIYTLVNGIELFIKACEYAAYPERVRTAPPKVPDLLAAFAAAPYPKDEFFVALARVYTGGAPPDLLRRFLAQSGLSAADLLTTRRHISDNGFFTTLERYQPLLFDQAEGRVFFAEVLAAVEPVIPRAGALAGDIDDDGHPGRLVQALLVA
jgi:hypothetical protein